MISPTSKVSFDVAFEKLIDFLTESLRSDKLVSLTPDIVEPFRHLNSPQTSKLLRPFLDLFDHEHRDNIFRLAPRTLYLLCAIVLQTSYDRIQEKILHNFMTVVTSYKDEHHAAREISRITSTNVDNVAVCNGRQFICHKLSQHALANLQRADIGDRAKRAAAEILTKLVFTDLATTTTLGSDEARRCIQNIICEETDFILRLLIANLAREIIHQRATSFQKLFHADKSQLPEEVFSYAKADSFWMHNVANMIDQIDNLRAIGICQDRVFRLKCIEFDDGLFNDEAGNILVVITNSMHFLLPVTDESPLLIEVPVKTGMILNTNDQCALNTSNVAQQKLQFKFSSLNGDRYFRTVRKAIEGFTLSLTNGHDRDEFISIFNKASMQVLSDNDQEPPTINSSPPIAIKKQSLMFAAMDWNSEDDVWLLDDRNEPCEGFVDQENADQINHEGKNYSATNQCHQSSQDSTYLTQISSYPVNAQATELYEKMLSSQQMNLSGIQLVNQTPQISNASDEISVFEGSDQESPSDRKPHASSRTSNGEGVTRNITALELDPSDVQEGNTGVFLKTVITDQSIPNNPRSRRSLKIEKKVSDNVKDISIDDTEQMVSAPCKRGEATVESSRPPVTAAKSLRNRTVQVVGKDEVSTSKEVCHIQEPLRTTRSRAIKSTGRPSFNTDAGYSTAKYAQPKAPRNESSGLESAAISISSTSVSDTQGEISSPIDNSQSKVCKAPSVLYNQIVTTHTVNLPIQNSVLQHDSAVTDAIPIGDHKNKRLAAHDSYPLGKTESQVADIADASFAAKLDQMISLTTIRRTREDVQSNLNSTTPFGNRKKFIASVNAAKSISPEKVTKKKQASRMSARRSLKQKLTKQRGDYDQTQFDSKPSKSVGRHSNIAKRSRNQDQSCVSMVASKREILANLTDLDSAHSLANEESGSEFQIPAVEQHSDLNGEQSHGSHEQCTTNIPVSWPKDGQVHTSQCHGNNRTPQNVLASKHLLSLSTAPVPIKPAQQTPKQSLLKQDVHQSARSKTREAGKPQVVHFAKQGSVNQGKENKKSSMGEPGSIYPQSKDFQENVPEHVKPVSVPTRGMNNPDIGYGHNENTTTSFEVEEGIAPPFDMQLQEMAVAEPEVAHSQHHTHLPEWSQDETQPLSVDLGRFDSQNVNLISRQYNNSEHQAPHVTHDQLHITRKRKLLGAASLAVKVCNDHSNEKDSAIEALQAKFAQPLISDATVEARSSESTSNTIATKRGDLEVSLSAKDETNKLDLTWEAELGNKESITVCQPDAITRVTAISMRPPPRPEPRVGKSRCSTNIRALSQQNVAVHDVNAPKRPISIGNSALPSFKRTKPYSLRVLSESPPISGTPMPFSTTLFNDCKKTNAHTPIAVDTEKQRRQDQGYGDIVLKATLAKVKSATRRSRNGFSPDFSDDSLLSEADFEGTPAPDPKRIILKERHPETQHHGSIRNVLDEITEKIMFRVTHEEDILQSRISLLSHQVQAMVCNLTSNWIQKVIYEKNIMLKEMRKEKTYLDGVTELMRPLDDRHSQTQPVSDLLEQVIQRKSVIMLQLRGLQS